MDKQSTDEAKAGVNKVPPQVEQDRDKTIAPQNMEQIISRENSRRQLFEKAINCSLWIVVGLYVVFAILVLVWTFCKKEDKFDWHIALILVLPATTILLSIVHVLKYKDPNDKLDESIFIPYIKEVVELLKLILSKSNNGK